MKIIFEIMVFRNWTSGSTGQWFPPKQETSQVSCMIALENVSSPVWGCTSFHRITMKDIYVSNASMTNSSTWAIEARPSVILENTTQQFSFLQFQFLFFLLNSAYTNVISFFFKSLFLNPFILYHCPNSFSLSLSLSIYSKAWQTFLERAREFVNI